MYKHSFGKSKKCIQTLSLTKTSIITPSTQFARQPYHTKNTFIPLKKLISLQTLQKLKFKPQLHFTKFIYTYPNI